MNASHSPRWSCAIVRALGGVRSDGDRRFGARHVAHCPACQAYFARANALDTTLHADARARRATPSSGLDDRIMYAVMRSSREAAPRANPARFALAFAGGVAAVAVVVGMLLSTRNGTPVPIERITPLAPPPVSTTRSAPAVTHPAVALLPQPAATAQAIVELATPVKSALSQDPLQNEVKSVYADARSAVQFLALNFLPSGAVARNDASSVNAGG